MIFFLFLFKGDMFAGYFKKRATSKLKKVNKLCTRRELCPEISQKTIFNFPLQKLENYHFETVGNAVG